MVLAVLVVLGAVFLHELGHCVSWWRAGRGTCTFSVEPPSAWGKGEWARASTPSEDADHRWLSPLTVAAAVVGGVAVVALAKP